MSGYRIGADRGQMALLPEQLDDYIGEENEVRVIDAFVDGLDLVELKISRAVAARTGAPGYHPRRWRCG